jgi:hypothetical protein
VREGKTSALVSGERRSTDAPHALRRNPRLQQFVHLEWAVPPYDYSLDATDGLDVLIQAEAGPHD